MQNQKAEESDTKERLHVHQLMFCVVMAHEATDHRESLANSVDRPGKLPPGLSSILYPCLTFNGELYYLLAPCAYSPFARSLAFLFLNSKVLSAKVYSSETPFPDR